MLLMDLFRIIGFLVVIGDNGDYVPQNTSETSYTVTSTDSEGCQSVDTINITINNLPNPGPIIFN